MALRVQGTAGQIRARLPASIATVTDPAPAARAESGAGPWLRVELRAERLDWLPPLLASLGLPFVIEQPENSAASSPSSPTG